LNPDSFNSKVGNPFIVFILWWENFNILPSKLIPLSLLSNKIFFELIRICRFKGFF
jgi:hypothetical protein